MTAKRKTKELSVVATGVQNSEARFGKRRRFDNDDLPPISPWRCNLTGLSHEQDLYFVAYGRDMYVYVPQFPSQAVSRHPALILTSEPSNPHLKGYIDRREPHTINNLVVQYLGSDEVVATVRDDGDVEVVLVRHIVQAIERRAQPDSAISDLADEVRPIFQSNVGISAWGLAIHTESRILATSSNAHEVRVFKFGLAHEDDDIPLPKSQASDAMSTEGNVLMDVGSSQEHEARRPSIKTLPRREQRRMDVTETVLNGNANIPSISFCNTGDDPEGRWLLTTDIEGYCRLMDLHADHGADVALQSFRFGRAFPSNMPGMDRHNAGWAIMFLDTRSFILESTFHTALGLQEGQGLPGWQTNNTTWDLSDTVEQLRDNSEAFVYDLSKKRRQQQGEPRSTNASQPLNAAVALPAPEASHDRSSTQRGAPDDMPEGLVQELAEQDENMESESETGTQQPSQDDQTDSSGGTDDDSGDEDEDLYADDEDFSLEDHIALIQDDQNPDDEGTEDSLNFNSMYNGRRIFGNQPIFSPPGGLAHNLPCPIFHASVRNVYLLQPSQGTPMIGMAHPLRQSVQTGLAFLCNFERLNMHAYIPQIGVLILASQKGRALVLSLTKLRKSAQYPPEMQGSKPRRTCYAMRVERILPLASQERAGQRPFAPLHGIAASPLQGAGEKRWRIMMMYQDHSILSYEVSRKQSRESVSGLDSLVV
ncbi:hypothetical protein EJ03DRAFT_373354 [Teratosphaeria nubilosa]|uniref:Uncharacterized protein n=1 Tax=Teratosphaeria nubilosa TaxID=161662 RepID=A0A6G1LD28_9PEZI|nr:hypothetical protein EJ03DRAFT_373354 [Teratosphaeria nubilosa]